MKTPSNETKPDTAAEPAPASLAGRLLSKREVLTITSLSYPTIWSMMQRGAFPRSVRLGAGRVAWHGAEVQAWLDALPRQKLKGDVPPEQPRRRVRL